MKKSSKIILGFLVVLAVAIGGYFLAGHFGLLSKRKVAYTQPQMESASPLIAQAVSDTQEQDATSSTSAPDAQAASEPSLASSGGATNIATTNDVATSNKNIPSPDAGKIVDRFVSWGFQKATSRTIDTMIIHSSYDATGSDPFDVDGVIAEWKALGVSPHYLIARDGTTYHLVADQDIAYHAGVSKMPPPDGRTNVNDFSIGVEMINTLDGKFTPAQYASLNSLIATLKSKYPIKNILGHDQISPGRKTDPWGIDWAKVQK